MASALYTNARVPAALVDIAGDDAALVDCAIAVRDGRIESVRAAAEAPAEAGATDLGGRLVFPGFIDAHTHLDKAFTWDRAPNPAGEFWDAIEVLSRDRVNWTEDDLYRRGRFALRCAAAHGTVAMRTHVDTASDFGAVSHAVMERLREEWRGVIDLQTVSLCGVEDYAGANGRKIADTALRYPDALLGGMPKMGPDLDAQLDGFLELAGERGVGVDLHVDENGMPEAECLRHVAEAVLRTGFPYPVACGHVCSLAVQPEARARSTLEKVREAGLNVISLPMCNLYLQGRPGEVGGFRKTPHWRGVSLLHELCGAGVPVACASDNVRDAFFAWGDFDMMEVLGQSVRIAHLDTVPGEAVRMVTETPAAIMGHADKGRIAPGFDGRLVVFEARSINELLARPGRGRRLAGFGETMPEPPPYSELAETR